MSRAVIFLHGFLTNKEDFGVLPRKLGKFYDKVYCVTFPGHGKKPNYKKFTVEATFERALTKFDKLKEEYDVVDIVGFSMGGAIGTYIASCRDVGKLVLLAPANKFLNPLHPFSSAKFWFNKIFEVIGRLSEGERFKEAYKESIAVYVENEKMSIDLALNHLIPIFSYRTLSTFNKIIKKCNANLTVINNEMLIVWGKLDQLVPILSPHWLMSICNNPNKQFLELEDISHLMLISKNSEYIMNEITNFLINGTTTSTDSKTLEIE